MPQTMKSIFKGMRSEHYEHWILTKQPAHRTGKEATDVMDFDMPELLQTCQMEILESAAFDSIEGSVQQEMQQAANYSPIHDWSWKPWDGPGDGAENSNTGLCG